MDMQFRQKGLLCKMGYQCVYHVVKLLKNIYVIQKKNTLQNHHSGLYEYEWNKIWEVGWMFLKFWVLHELLIKFKGIITVSNR